MEEIRLTTDIFRFYYPIRVSTSKIHNTYSSKPKTDPKRIGNLPYTPIDK